MATNYTYISPAHNYIAWERTSPTFQIRTDFPTDDPILYSGLDDGDVDSRLHTLMRVYPDAICFSLYTSTAQQPEWTFVRYL
jgi:hypothetical protein